jgi:hypothetical protein
LTIFLGATLMIFNVSIGNAVRLEGGFNLQQDPAAKPLAWALTKGTERFLAICQIFADITLHWATVVWLIALICAEARYCA